MMDMICDDEHNEEEKYDDTDAAVDDNYYDDAAAAAEEGNIDRIVLSMYFSNHWPHGIRSIVKVICHLLR